MIKTIITKSNWGALIIGKGNKGKLGKTENYAFNTTFYSDGTKIDGFLESMRNGDEVLLVLKKLSKKEILKYKVVREL